MSPQAAVQAQKLEGREFEKAYDWYSVWLEAGMRQQLVGMKLYFQTELDFLLYERAVKGKVTCARVRLLQIPIEERPALAQIATKVFADSASLAVMVLHSPQVAGSERAC